jgi:hypothetical protein
VRVAVTAALVKIHINQILQNNVIIDIWWIAGSPCIVDNILQTNKQTPWPLVHERTIPTGQPPLVDEI